MVEGITVGDIIQFGALGVLTLVLKLMFDNLTMQLSAKDKQIEVLTMALIDTKVNAKALELVTSLHAPMMQMIGAFASQTAVKAAPAFSEGKSERSEEPLLAAT